MNKEVNGEKKDDRGSRRGWDALQIMLQEQGVTGAELEEAQNSFYRGMEILSRLFLSCYLPERNDHERSRIFPK